MLSKKLEMNYIPKNKSSDSFLCKVVIDTNVFVSAFIFGGLMEKFIDLIDDNMIQACFSPETLKELHLILSHSKFQKRRETLPFSVDAFLKNLLSKSIIVYPQTIVKVIKDDPSDDKFLACALSCQASFIISGDKHLLKLKKFHKIPILQPKEFLKIIEK